MYRLAAEASPKWGVAQRCALGEAATVMAADVRQRWHLLVRLELETDILPCHLASLRESWSLKSLHMCNFEKNKDVYISDDFEDHCIFL